MSVETTADPSQLSMLDLIEAARHAPSPDNNQPWRFQPSENCLRIIPDADRGLPSDADGMFMYLALGAAAENAAIAACEKGLATTVRLISGDSGAAASDPTVELTFSDAGADADPLCAQLQQRCTSRKLYATTTPAEEVLDNLSGEADRFAGTQVQWLTSRPAIKRLASLVAQGDLVRLQHEPFHAELYKQLRFTEREVEATRDGLDLRTLELPPGAAGMLAWLRDWRRMRTVHRLGLGRLLALPSMLAIRRSGAIGILTADTAGHASYLRCGRALQRLWLAAAANGLSLQPLGSLPIFFRQLADGAGGLAAEQTGRLRKLQRQLIDLTGTQEQVLVMIVRVGYGPPPTARSLRRDQSDLMHVDAVNDEESAQ